MKKIYVDQFYTDICKHIDYRTLHPFVGNDCDIIAICFYNNDWLQLQQIIDHWLPKTQKLLVYISEPTPGNSGISFDQFLKNNQTPGLHLFGDAVLNFESANFETAISWFVMPENYYVTQEWGQQLLSQLTDRSPDSKMFDCLLGNSRSHRDFIADQIAASTDPDQFVFSYHCGNLDQAIWPTDLRPIDQNANTLYFGQEINLAAILPVEIYNQTWYSIVAETTAENSYNQYTEKVAKPIVARRPFVAFAGQHYLKNLKKLGFRTFDSVFDESYDSISDFGQRMESAWQQVEFLCAQDPALIYSQVQEILDHNQQHFLTTNWHSAILRHFE